jgi:glycosyltransferase involved in cell wall biosynthesis
VGRTRVLLVGRTRYRFPLTQPLRRKFDALERRLDVHVVATAATHADRAAAEDGFELVPPRRLLDGARFYVELPLRVSREIRRFEPEAVVAQSPYEALGVLLGRVLARRPTRVVVEVHGDPRTATRLYGSQARRLLSPIADAAAATAVRRADRVRTVGPFTSSVARELGAEPDATFPAYTDAETFAARPPSALPEQPCFLFVGVLERYKNVDGLIEAWRRVARLEPTARLRVVGDGSLREGVLALTDEIPFRTIWHRRLPPDGVATAIDRASVLVLPSRSEGLPRIALEALERGRPVIGARTGGIPDVVRDGENGLLVEPEDASSLIAAMVRLAGDRVLLHRLARRARPSAGRLVLSPDEYARRVEALVA